MCCDSDYKITIFTSGNKVLLRLGEITGHMSPHAPLAIKRMAASQFHYYLLTICSLFQAASLLFWVDGWWRWVGVGVGVVIIRFKANSVQLVTRLANWNRAWQDHMGANITFLLGFCAP